MPSFIGVECKAPGCGEPILLEETYDTERSVTIPLKMKPRKNRLRCQTCGSENDYTEQDEVRIVGEDEAGDAE